MLQRAHRSNEAVSCQQVIDGDTLKAIIDGHSITIRLLHKRAETVKPIGRSSVTVPKLRGDEVASDGKSVLLALNPNYERIDKYGRLLAYVRLEDATSGKCSSMSISLKKAMPANIPSMRRIRISIRSSSRTMKLRRKRQEGLWGKCKENK